jgi:serine/threonine protein kinase
MTGLDDTFLGSEAPDEDPLVGTLLAGKYEVQKTLGRGGMGAVYLARQIAMDRQVAVKVLLTELSTNPHAAKRFVQEAKAVSRLQHPNTITIHDYGTSEAGQMYIVMELLKGQTLASALHTAGRIDALRAAKIISQVCASLAEAHEAGIIHRDLKPDNIFLTQVGRDPDHAKVLDFGIAKVLDAEGASKLTATGMVFGTARYMSPEQAQGKQVDGRADVYSLGVVLFEILTGSPPFSADTVVALLLKHVTAPVPMFTEACPDHAVDPEIERITRRALQKDPGLRYQRISDFAEELDAFARTLGGYPRPSMSAPPERSARPPEPAPRAGPPTVAEAQPLSPDPTLVSAPLQRSKPAVWGAAAFLFAAVTTTIVTRREPSASVAALPAIAPVPAAEPSPAAPSASPAQSAQPALVTINLVGRPGLRVLDVASGALLATTPGVVRLPRSTDSVRLRVERDGYRPEDLLITPDVDQTKTLEVKRKLPPAKRFDPEHIANPYQ